MKNYIFIFYFLCGITPLFSDTGSSSPIMMLKKGSFGEKSSGSNIQHERSRMISDDSMSQDRFLGIENEDEAKSEVNTSPSFNSSIGKRFQQTEELRFLVKIVQKMQTRMQEILDEIQSQGESTAFSDSYLTEQMSQEEQDFIQDITNQISDQTIIKMTEEQIAKAIIQEQEKTARILAAYYDVENSNDVNEATEALSNYDQIKEDLTSAIRDAFINTQRAYLAKIILPRAIEEEWRRHNDREEYEEPYRFASLSLIDAIPRDVHQEAIRTVELGGLTRVAHKTNEELDRAFIERGYLKDTEEKKEGLKDVLKEEDHLDRHADEQIKIRVGIHAVALTTKKMKQAYATYEDALNGGEINFDTRSSRGVSPDGLSAEETIVHDQYSTIRDNQIMMSTLAAYDKSQDDLNKALQGYYQAMTGNR